MKLYTEEQIEQAIKMARSSQNIFTTPFIYDKHEIIEQLNTIELPSDEELQLMSEQHAAFCGLQNFFDEDEIMVIRHHWIKGYEKAVNDFLTYGGNK